MADRRARTEPSAELRSAAYGLWQMYVALTAEGFTEKQALTIIGSLLAASPHLGDETDG
jgi:hypothetical protein